MEYGGMVHALEEIHNMLKSDGVLIDIHPVSEPSSIELHQASKVDLVGRLTIRQWCFDFEQADLALAEITQRGMFILERKAIFDLPTYYTSSTEMGLDLEETVEIFARDPQATTELLPHIEALASRAEDLMRSAGSDAELIMHERTHISRLLPT